MKTVEEIKEVAKERVNDLTDSGKKAAYAVVGAPVVAGKRIADYAGKVTKKLQEEFESWVAEGERLSGEVREGKVVAEIKERVDFDQLQDRVERLKDQLEEVLTNWRETFMPGGDKSGSEPAAKKTTVKKAAAKTTKKSSGAKQDTAAKAEEDADSES